MIVIDGWATGVGDSHIGRNFKHCWPVTETLGNDLNPAVGSQRINVGWARRARGRCGGNGCSVTSCSTGGGGCLLTAEVNTAQVKLRRWPGSPACCGAANVMGRAMELLRERYAVNAPAGWYPVMKQLRAWE